MDAQPGLSRRVSYAKQLPASGAGSGEPLRRGISRPIPIPNPRDSTVGTTPILDGFTRAYGGAFANYARNELGFKTEMTYALLDRDVNRRWEWGSGAAAVRACRRASPTISGNMLASNPSFHTADRSWLQRPRHALWRQPLCGRSPAARTCGQTGGAERLSRRAYVLYAARSARRIHRRCQGLLRRASRPTRRRTERRGHSASGTAPGLRD